MRTVRFPFLLFLVLALGLDAGAVHRLVASRLAGGTVLVLCAHDGPRAVTLDAEGNPVDRSASCRFCHDCCFLVAAEPPGPPGVVRRAGRGERVVHAVESPGRVPAPYWPRPHGRAPPLFA